MLSLIVARDRNHVIGKQNQLPWHLPQDLAWFRQNTLGKPVIMGRKTYQSIGRLLPKRPNIIVSRHNFSVDGAISANSLEQALQQAAPLADEIMLIGGGELFKQGLPLVDRIYLTEVDADFDGDTFFELDLSNWHVVQQSQSEIDEQNPYLCRFMILERNPSK